MPVDTIDLILAPYHVGVADFRVGAGPKCILGQGLFEQLQAFGKTVTITEIASVDNFEGEIGRSFEIIRRIASAVASAEQRGSFPIILAGNCNATVGVAAGLSSDERQLVWFDAHSDLDTPDEALSGYFDGMGVSMLTGESWKALMATVPNHRPMKLDQITYCGVRDLSDTQREKLDRSPARVVYGDITGSCVHYANSLDQALKRSIAPSCLIHLDVDCLDTSVGYANEYAAPGGLNEEDLISCLDVVARRCAPVSLTVASLNPHLRGSNAIANIATRAIIHLIRKVGEIDRHNEC